MPTDNARAGPTERLDRDTLIVAQASVRPGQGAQHGGGDGRVDLEMIEPDRDGDAEKPGDHRYAGLDTR